MLSKYTLWLIASLLVIAVSAGRPTVLATGVGEESASPTVTAVDTACPQALPPSASCKLRPSVPKDLSKPDGDPSSLESLQQDFDVMSWYTFIAINWPARDGSADQVRVIGEHDAPAVWESWKESYEVFLPDGKKPAAWDEPHVPPPYFSAQAKDDFRREGKAVSKMGKGYSWSLPTMPFQNEQPFESGPLIDQEGRYARFEILMNRDMFEYIVGNDLYNIEGQEKAKSTVFPCGAIVADTVNHLDVRDGAIVVKAAWKILTDEEVKSGHFHVRDAVIYSPKEKDIPHGEQRAPNVKIGLVGLHIVHKSKDSQQWTWSTFEQVDNNPEYGEDPTKKHYSFFAAGSANQKINVPPDRPWDPTRGLAGSDDEKPQPPELASRRSQIVRMIPISKATHFVNAQFQKKLREVNSKSVWQYYQLVSTQWPTRKVPNCAAQERVLVDVTAGPAPVFLGNSTLESYIQGQVPNTSSSCMECHANAMTTAGRFADFSYLLQQAKHRKPE